jgi:hypothetical protein
LLGHLRRALTTWLLVAPLGFGCTEQPAAGPEEVVTAFFGAIGDGDCAEALHWLDGPAKERFESEPCEEALGSLARKRFERVLEARVDGRNAKMHLVRVRFAEEHEPVIIGVRRTRRGHRIVSF